MIRPELLQKSAYLIARFACEVKTSNALGLFDINTVAEDFLVPIFAIVLDCPDLQNQNRIQMNFPAVDLGSTTKRISIQVSSDASSNKINETLTKFKSHDLKSKFDKLLIYALKDKQSSYSSNKLKTTISKLDIEFDASQDVWDYQDLSEQFGKLPNEKIQDVIDLLEGEFRKRDSQKKFRSELEKFLKISAQKIEDEKISKKYIPSVFVETTQIKEEMRYFAHPMFFYRKIDDQLNNISLAEFNKLLNLARIDQLQLSLNEVVDVAIPKNLLELRDRVCDQNHAVSKVIEHISAYSRGGGDIEAYVPKECFAGYWDVLGFSIDSTGRGIFYELESISQDIDLTQAKIFLVTGMAGQGKTNFVCDLVENQFQKFEIPTIFIPARKLNDFPSPNRIHSYITNNRFAPDVRNLHELLSLFNAVAAECQKPFIIAVDGINEIGDLDGFVSELRVFLDALCQYEFIKIIVTCRSEFFDHKFSDVFEPQFTKHLHRIQNLQNEMSEDNKKRLITSYFEHFKIDASLSKSAKQFLKNDLILLRIFCDIHEGKSIGYVTEIYKGEIFEKYLMMKIEEFSASNKRTALASIYKICSRMFEQEDFTQLPIEGFDDTELEVVEKLISEDVILRREIPTTGLDSVGIENISFTYDEMRDFLLAHFTVGELAQSMPFKIGELFEKIREWPIYEGFFRYAYVIARKKKCELIIHACESYDGFEQHYINNLALLSPDIQTHEDVERVKEMLATRTRDYDLGRLSGFLFKRRDETDHLNIRILFDHLRGLEDDELEKLLRAMLSQPESFPYSDLRKKVSNLLSSFSELDQSEQIEAGIPALAIALFLLPFAYWEQRESIKNLFVERASLREFRAAIEACVNTQSRSVNACITEILLEVDSA